MKKSLAYLMPALALLTLGGCASTGALSTTENDGVYYSSQDRTTQNASASVAATAPAEQAQADGDISNPDYAADGQRSSGVTESTEYYDDDYAYSSRIRRFHQPYYRGFGYGYNDFMYADPFWYGGSSYYGNGFYDPFYGPSYGYGGYGGSFVNINIGFGSPWGWGYNPWRYGRGFGYGGYDTFGYGGYGYGGYGYGGYGNYGIYNNYNYYNNNNSYYGNSAGSSRTVRYGSRTSRSGEAGTAGRASSGTGNVTGSRSRATGGVAEPTGGRAATDGLLGNGVSQPSGRGRTRATDAGVVGGVPAGVSASPQPQIGRVRDINGTANQNSDQLINQINNGGTTSQPAVYERSRRRMAETTGAGTETGTSQPQYSQPRRSRFSELNTNIGGNNQSQSQATDQPARRQRTFESPQRTYEAPQRTYEAPARSYEAPSRSYEAPSRSSAPSNSGGGDGGGRGRGRN